ncbi:hypothetical protein DET56_107298 [Paenibacillus pabuli]|uniref:Uncharacterized protein n=1 Tax=Paenibacillus pabuli TaxID=1472 RepID=A0A855XTC0_9BACL|nr:hypothetical protein DET56_107298 [Paenibacillus pabuli]PXW06081.1 hypothetical protein DEU73_107298 [Paenibacillus taichungensis]SEN72072.1 hypothetical protein SAMN05518670_2519 [Paenibacillus sp. OK076]
MRPPLTRKRKLIFEHQFLQYFYCMKKKRARSSQNEWLYKIKMDMRCF